MKGVGGGGAVNGGKAALLDEDWWWGRTRLVSVQMLLPKDSNRCGVSGLFDDEEEPAKRNNSQGGNEAKLSCIHENIILKSQIQAVGLQEESSAATSAVELGCLVAKLQILIISHQVSPVNAGLHPDVKHTHVFSHTLPSPLSSPGLCMNRKLLDEQRGTAAMLRRAQPTSRCQFWRCVRGSADPGLVLCGYLRTRG